MQRFAVASLVLLATLSCALFAAMPTRAQGTEPLALVRSFYAPDYRNDLMPLSQRLGALLDAAIANCRSGRDEELEYRLLRENGIWTIDDILYLKGEQTSLSQMLIDGANEKP